MEVVFALTRHNYDSYSDYVNLAKNAWGKWCYIDEINFTTPNRVYIFSPFNGEIGPHIQNHIHEKKCKLVWWNLERPPRDEKHAEHKQNVMELFKHVDYMIVSDRYYQGEYYKEFGNRVIFMPMGYHECLCEYPFNSVRSKYSFAHISYVWGRRDILKKLPFCMPNSWGDQRKQDLIRTKFMVNIHQDQYKILEPLRFIIAVAHGLPIISENLHNSLPYVPGVHFIQTSYEEILNKSFSCNKEDYSQYAQIAKNAFEMMKTNYPFNNTIQDMTRWIT